MCTLHIRSGFVGLALVGSLLAVPATALAEEITYNVMLEGANEVPAVTTSASGVAGVTFDTDTKMLTWSVTYEGLSGEVTGAHFHGPAESGANAGVAVALDLSAQPIVGSATLTDEQTTQLTAGFWYVNIHTAANSGGEIRGQVKADKPGYDSRELDGNPFTF